MSDETETLPPPPAPPAPPLVRAPRQFLGHRSPTDAYLAGLAGGVGERLNIDPFFVRAAGVGLAVWWSASGAPAAGPLIYGAAWLVIPLQGEQSVLRRLFTRAGFQEAAGVGLLVALISVLLGSPGLLIVAALCWGAWMLLADRPAGQRLPEPFVGPPSPREAAVERASFGADAAAERGQRRRAIAWGRARRGEFGPETVRVPRRRRSPALWPLALSLLVVWFVAYATIDRVRDIGLDPAVAVDGAMLILGAVMATSLWRGRAGGVVAMALLLVPVWFGFSVADVNPVADSGRLDGNGGITNRPSSLNGETALDYEHGFGRQTIDLTLLGDELTPGSTLTVNASQEGGLLRVYVPSDVLLEVSTHVGAGRTLVRGIYGPGSYSYTDEWGWFDRTSSRSFEFAGPGCFYSPLPWKDLVSRYRAAGVDLPSEGAADPFGGDVETIAAIEAAGYPAPRYQLVGFYGDQSEWDAISQSDFVYEDVDQLSSIERDKFFADAQAAGFDDAVWEYRTKLTNSGGEEPCTNADLEHSDLATVKIDASIGVGSIEVIRV